MPLRFDIVFDFFYTWMILARQMYVLLLLLVMFELIILAMGIETQLD